jgi:hypothetical protein
LNRLRRFISNLSNMAVLAILIGSAFLTGIVSLVSFHTGTSSGEWWESALQNFSTEMIGAFLTFILIDVVIGGREKRAEERREEIRRLRRRLIKRLRSPNREITASAADELRRWGWLEDGSLEGAYLSHANLRRVDLKGADLEGARLTRARLEGSCLSNAKLEGTTLKAAQLAQAHTLRGAIMPDGKKYDGRLSLKGDLKVAEDEGVCLDDPEAMAKFFGVSVAEYVGGQEWARQKLGAVCNKVEIDREKDWWKV